MTTLLDIAAILETTESNVLKRAFGMRLLPVCSRCGGTGHYSFNGSHSICYGCNGKGQRLPKANELQSVYDYAIESKSNGKFAEYMAFLKSTATIKNATDKILNAWKATGISEAYDWRKAHGSDANQRDYDISIINRKMAVAFDNVNKASMKLNPRSATYHADCIALADMVNESLNTIEGARIEFLDYLK